MKTYWRVEVQFHPFLTLPLYGVVSFTLRAKKHSYPLERRLDGPQSRSGCGGEDKIPSPCGAVMTLCDILHLAEEIALFGMI
jgi:hypothetical protein